MGDIWAGGTSSLLLRLLLGWVPLALIKQIPGVSGSEGGRRGFQSKALPVGGREESWKEYERGIGRWIRGCIHVSGQIHRKGI